MLEPKDVVVPEPLLDEVLLHFSANPPSGVPKEVIEKVLQVALAWCSNHDLEMIKRRSTDDIEGFESLPPGWMALFQDDDQQIATEPVPGVLFTRDGIIAAVFDGAELVPITDPTFIRIFYEHRNRHRGGGISGQATNPSPE